MNEVDWMGIGGMTFLVAIFALITVIAVVVIRQVFAIAQTRMAASQAAAAEYSYRALVEDVTSAQRSTAEQLTTIAASLDDLQTRVAAMERMMREVE
jgi:uncharacterized membrane protein